MSEHKDELLRLERRAQRERLARQQAEKILEKKSRELYLANQTLQDWSKTLEEQVHLRTEELELQTRELQLLFKERERFTANVTHELRTPLQGILGFANLGVNRCENASKEKLEKWFKTIHSSGETRLTLVNNLLDISKLDANMMDIVHQHFSVNDLYQDVSDEFSLRCKEKDVRMALIGDEHICLDADQFRMGQVFRNLIGNALKFCDESTTITIEALHSASIVELRVNNQGTALPANEAESIFEAFTEASSTRGNAGGTGLGLAICKHIIEAHGGKIWLDTDHEETSFVVEIPAKKSSKKQESAIH